MFCVIHLSNGMQWQHQICCQRSTRFNTPCPRNGRSSPQSVNLFNVCHFCRCVLMCFHGCRDHFVPRPKTQERKIEQTSQLHSASIYNVPVTMIHNVPQEKAKKQLVLYTSLRVRDGWVGGDWCKSNKARPNKEENRGKMRNITIHRTKIRQLETNENNRINHQ